MAATKDKNSVTESPQVGLPEGTLLIKSEENDGATILKRGFPVAQGVVVVDTECKDGTLLGIKIRFSRDAVISPVKVDGVVTSGDLSERSA
jgi:hypothetical protein